MADDRRGEAGRRVAPVGVKVEEPILAMLEREVERGEVLEVAARLGGALEQHVEHVGAGACTDEPRRLEQTARLQQHGDRGRVDGRAAVEIQQQEAQRQVELLERRQVRAHLLHDRVGRAAPAGAQQTVSPGWSRRGSQGGRLPAAANAASSKQQAQRAASAAAAAAAKPV
eukprot:7380147-Prymnesium_polylepis.5